MNREMLGRKLDRVREQLAKLQAEEKKLAEEKRMADEAEAMKIIKKEKISPERLVMLNSISEAEVARLLAQREKEENQTDEKEAVS